MPMEVPVAKSLIRVPLVQENPNWEDLSGFPPVQDDKSK